VTILTKTENDPYATRYILDEKGGVKGENRAAQTRGTSVTVRDLFVKFPVRRNYIKEKSRMAAELKEIEFYLKSIGLANPKVKLVKYCLDKC
jgi:DNA mismatch repair ATPase MutL